MIYTIIINSKIIQSLHSNNLIMIRHYESYYIENMKTK